ncbi:hypothetical protein [Streptomyces botrytidirepellens]|uniref:hypothetical protein n=1 Tax=Streptomyces botrytidirepellens TaxID=2486417 RepID=UPI001C833E38|nr:hypothetical protein [Streptomyces botrytidirepellens]
MDQTLGSIKGGVSRSLYERAFEKVTGRELEGLAAMAGRTEQAIMVETLRLNGVDEPEALFGDFYAALTAAAGELKGQRREVGVVLPGAREAIASCAGRRAVQSAVTGNLRPVTIT